VVLDAAAGFACFVQHLLWFDFLVVQTNTLLGQICVDLLCRHRIDILELLPWLKPLMLDTGKTLTPAISTRACNCNNKLQGVMLPCLHT
jgi:hypothetical protein